LAFDVRCCFVAPNVRQDRQITQIIWQAVRASCNTILAERQVSPVLETSIGAGIQERFGGSAAGWRPNA
jgi:hypothetical protein